MGDLKRGWKPRRRGGWVLAFIGGLLCASGALAAGTRTFSSGSAAADFPPGAWTDGVERHLDDFKGKVVIIFTFDPAYLDSPQEVKRKLAVYDIFKDKPVVFLGVVSGHREISLNRTVLKQLDVPYPMYYDNIGQMGTRYNYYSTTLRMIDANGNSSFSVLDPQAVDHALKDVKWKYKDGGYDKKLDAVIEMLEWNHYEAGIKQLKSMRKSGNKDLAAAAEKLYQDVHAEGEKWKSEADSAKDSDPVKAYDLYMKIAAAFAGEDLAKPAADEAKQLKSTKPVQDEFAARAMYSKLSDVIPRAKYEQRLDVADYVESIGKKYPETPTGKKAKELWAEMLGTK
jgi:hypothetical protein